MPIVVSVSPCFMTCAEHAALIGAERHADADLAAAFRDHVRQHAVGADRGEQQRQAGEAAEQLREQARPA